MKEYVVYVLDAQKKVEIIQLKKVSYFQCEVLIICVNLSSALARDLAILTNPLKKEVLIL